MKKHMKPNCQTRWQYKEKSRELPAFLYVSKQEVMWHFKRGGAKQGLQKTLLVAGRKLWGVCLTMWACGVFRGVCLCVCVWLFDLPKLVSRPVLKYTCKTERVTTQTHSVSICVSDSFNNNTSFSSPAAQLVWRRMRTRTAGSTDISREWGTHARSHTDTDAQTSTRKVKEKQLLVRRG